MKIRFVRLISILLLIVMHLNMEAKTSMVFTKDCKNAYHAAVEFRLAPAEQHLATARSKNSENLMVDFVQHYIWFLKAVNSESDADEDRFINKSEVLIDELENTQLKSPYKGYCLTDLYMMRAMIRGRNKAYIKAYNNLREAEHTIDENMKLFPNFLPNKKAKAIMHLGFGSIPEKHSWILTVLNIDASVEEGLKMLEELAHVSLSNESLEYLQTEVILLSSFAMSNFSNKKQEDNWLYRILTKEENRFLYQHNPMLCFAKVSMHQHRKENREAIKAINFYKAKDDAEEFHFLNFLKGECLQYSLDPRAIESFDRYIDNFPGDSYRKAAHQKKAWMLLIYKNEDAYKNELRKVNTCKTTILDGDKLAQKEYDKGETPNVYLLKGRLLSDGGYNENAIAELRKGAKVNSYTSEDEQLEYTYRMGRIFHAEGKIDKALSYYQKTIDDGQNSDRYFAANAALMSGQIFEKQKKFDQALAMYRRIKEMDFDEYHDSIIQKAKAGINRIEKE